MPEFLKVRFEKQEQIVVLTVRLSQIIKEIREGRRVVAETPPLHPAYPGRPPHLPSV